MPLTHDVGDIAVYTIAGQNLLAYFEEVSYTVEETQVNGSSVLRDGESPNGTKLNAKISTTLLSTYASPDRVSHLMLSTYTMGGTSYLGVLKSIEVSGKFTAKKRAGVGAWWTRPQNVTKTYSFAVELDCDDTVAAAIMVKMHSTVPTDRDMVISLTLNSVPVTIPARMQQVEHGAKRDDLQTLKITLEGKDPGTGAYPTAPTDTTGLLDLAFNGFQAPLAFTYASHATAGFQTTGQMIVSSFSFKIEDEALVKNQYTFDSYGTVTAAATSGS